jgi:hypothetical protein
MGWYQQTPKLQCCMQRKVTNTTTSLRLLFSRVVCLFVVKGGRFCPSTATMYLLLLLAHSSNRWKGPQSCYICGVVETNRFRGGTISQRRDGNFPFNEAAKMLPQIAGECVPKRQVSRFFHFLRKYASLFARPGSPLPGHACNILLFQIVGQYRKLRVIVMDYTSGCSCSDSHCQDVCSIWSLECSRRLDGVVCRRMVLSEVVT